MKMTKTQIIDMVAESMRAGKPPWRIGVTAINAKTNAVYNGMNAVLLNVMSQRRGYKSQWWATYHQWGQLKCQVKKRPDDFAEGEWGVRIVRWDDKDKLQTTAVFNAEQVFGLTAAKWKVPTKQVAREIDSAKFVDVWNGCPDKWLLTVEIANGFAGQPADPRYKEYLPNWLKGISDDPKFLTDAVSHALILTGVGNIPK